MTSRRNGRYVSRVGQKGQITLPLAIRKDIGIEPGQYVEIALVREGGPSYIKVQQKVPRLLELEGFAYPGHETLDWDEIQNQAWEKEAQRIASEGVDE